MCSIFDRLSAKLSEIQLGMAGIYAILRKYGQSDQSIKGIIEEPPIQEEEIPGSTAGVRNVMFFVDLTPFSDLTRPRTGDIVIINGVEYNVFDVGVDVMKGSYLSMSQR